MRAFNSCGEAHAAPRSRLRGAAAEAAGSLAEVLWPTRCVGCDAPGHLLCPSCTSALPAIDQASACPRCGAPFGGLVCTECTDCLEHDGDDDSWDRKSMAEPADPPVGFAALDGACCYGLHVWPLDRLVRAYKDAGERRLAPLIARMVVGALEGSLAARGDDAAPPPFDAVVFVPCSPEAYARRGFDHAGAIAREVSSLTGIPLLDALARGRSLDQRSLTRRERALNAAGSFVLVEDVAGRSVLLVDDVATTGATLGAAANALRGAGARSVFGATAARAW